MLDYDVSLLDPSPKVKNQGGGCDTLKGRGQVKRDDINR